MVLVRSCHAFLKDRRLGMFGEGSRRKQESGHISILESEDDWENCLPRRE